jgi:hypothetical protein
VRLTLQLSGQRPVAEVVLSRRNLLALVHKLDMPGSARTLETDADAPARWKLRVRGENDAEHYHHRGSRPPGRMHGDTEQFIADRAQDS